MKSESRYTSDCGLVVKQTPRAWYVCIFHLLLYARLTLTRNHDQVPLWCIASLNRFCFVESNQFHFSFVRIRRFFIYASKEFDINLCLDFNSVHHFLDTKYLCKIIHNHCSKKNRFLLTLYNREWIIWTGGRVKVISFQGHACKSLNSFLYKFYFYSIVQPSIREFNDNPAALPSFLFY